MNILMIYPKFPDTFWSFQYALEFIGKKAANPPLGLLTVAAMLPKEWHLKLVDENIQHLHNRDLQWADMVFLSAMSVQRSAVENVIQRCQKHNLPIVAGGPLFTEEYEQFPGVDHFILNEAEITLPPFLADLANGTPQHVYKTAAFADMTDSPVPMWELLDHKKYDCLSIQFTRGCPFDCDFCNITALLGRRVRTKSKTQILAELDKMVEIGWTRSIFFVDDNFIGNKKILKEEILPAIIEWRKNKTLGAFITEASINLADDEALMEMMVAAGFGSVFVGIETPEETCLEECNKGQNRNRNLLDSVRILHQKGLEVMGGFIVGFDNDTESIFQKQVDFIQHSGIITAMVGMLQALPGTKLYQRMEDENRISMISSGDNVNGDTNIVTVMEKKTLQQGYNQLLHGIYAPKPFYERVKVFLADFSIHQIGERRLEWAEIAAFLRSVVRLGLFGEEWRYYWDLVFWTAKHFPEKFALAIRCTIYGYHFRRVMEEHV
ncbi:MAG: B12-binding domain-containing radical SAM protein, partial [Anaerolineae bacterium]|nr:B12-binding domain-containing radical SAM protein [Anaerolineae bacterium]